jgi:hypothetical protein
MFRDNCSIIPISLKSRKYSAIIRSGILDPAFLSPLRDHAGARTTAHARQYLNRAPVGCRAVMHPTERCGRFGEFLQNLTLG